MTKIPTYQIDPQGQYNSKFMRQVLGINEAQQASLIQAGLLKPKTIGSNVHRYTGQQILDTITKLQNY